MPWKSRASSSAWPRAAKSASQRDSHERAGAEARRPLAQLAPGERGQHAPVGVPVAAQGPDLRVLARDHLGELGPVLGRHLPGGPQLLEIVRLEHLDAEAPAELRRVARLEDHREAQAAGRLGDVRAGLRLHRGRDGEADAARGGVLVPLVDGAAHRGPRAPGAAQDGVDLRLARADRRDRLVVGREEHPVGAPAAAQGDQVVDERVRRRERIGHEDGGGVARQQAERGRVVVAGDDPHPGAGQAADDAEGIGARRLEDDRGRIAGAHAVASS